VAVRTVQQGREDRWSLAEDISAKNVEREAQNRFGVPNDRGLSETLSEMDRVSFMHKVQVLGKVTKQEMDQLNSAQEAVNMVMKWILLEISDYSIQKKLLTDPPIITRVYQELSNGMLSYFRAMQIEAVPFPFPFAQVINYTMYGFFLFCPSIVMEILDVPKDVDLGFAEIWPSLVLNFCACAGYAALNEISIELEDPFGDDANDYPITVQQWAIVWAIEDCYFARTPSDFALPKGISRSSVDSSWQSPLGSPVPTSPVSCATGSASKLLTVPEAPEEEAQDSDLCPVKFAGGRRRAPSKRAPEVSSYAKRPDEASVGDYGSEFDEGLKLPRSPAPRASFGERDGQEANAVASEGPNDIASGLPQESLRVFFSPPPPRAGSGVKPSPGPSDPGALQAPSPSADTGLSALASPLRSLDGSAPAMASGPAPPLALRSLDTALAALRDAADAFAQELRRHEAERRQHGEATHPRLARLATALEVQIVKLALQGRGSGPGSASSVAPPAGSCRWDSPSVGPPSGGLGESSSALTMRRAAGDVIDQVEADIDVL